MRPSKFMFAGKALRYFEHSYNKASQNSRSIEVPIARYFITWARRKWAEPSILEVGDVLSHYGAITWPVVDLHARGKHVQKADIMSWEAPWKFELVISISTIEHIGYGRYAKKDEDGDVLAPPEPSAILGRLRELLAPAGAAVATAALGYNPTLDEAVRGDALGADQVWFMKRTSDANEWEECPRDEALAMPYRGRYRWGGGMVVALCRGWPLSRIPLELLYSVEMG